MEEALPNQSELLWKEITPIEGSRIPKDLSYQKSILYNNWILFFGNENDGKTIFAFNLVKQEWEFIIPNGESNIIASRESSLCFQNKNKIICYGCTGERESPAKKEKKEYKEKSKSTNWFGVNESYPTKKKATAKKASKAEHDGCLEILTIREDESKDFISGQDLQLLRAKWEEFDLNDKIPFYNGHTINVFENKVYLFGGTTSYDEVNQHLIIINLDSGEKNNNSVYYKNLENSNGSVITPRYQHSSVLYRDKIYYYGGIDEDYRYLTDMWTLNPVTLEWQEIIFPGLIPTPRAQSLCQIAGDTIFLLGGQNKFGLCEDLVTYSISNNKWESKSIGTQNLRNPTLFFVYQNKLIAGEGFNLYSLNIGSIEKSSFNDADPSSFKASDRKLFVEKTFADITFNVEGQNILAHKALLATRSSHFQKMFESGMKETYCSAIDVPDMKAPIFLGFLEYLYCGDLSLTEQTAKELLTLADKFCVHGLANICEKYLTKKVKTENVIDLTVLAELCGAYKLKEAGLEFMSENFDEIFDKQDISSLPSSILKQLFKYRSR